MVTEHDNGVEHHPVERPTFVQNLQEVVALTNFSICHDM
jgi:hypothetical protein